MIKVAGPYTIKQLRPTRTKSQDSEGFEVPFVGPFDALLGQEPQIGSTLRGFPPEYTVMRVALEPGDANNGRMVVTIEKPNPGGSQSGGSEQVGETIFECRWNEERRPIEEHKFCGRLKNDRPFYKSPASATDPDENPKFTSAADADGNVRQRTWEHWQSLDTDDYVVSGSGGWNLEQYKLLKEKGYESFPVAYPVARVTKYFRRPVSVPGGVYQKSTPPSQCGAPSEWVYVKVAAERTRQGRLYTTIEEWRGYWKADDLFFI